jgi:hypothetical protein
VAELAWIEACTAGDTGRELDGKVDETVSRTELDGKVDETVSGLIDAWSLVMLVESIKGMTGGGSLRVA